MQRRKRRIASITDASDRIDASDRTDASDRYVFLKANDDEALIEVDLALLESYSCRLAKMIVYDPPSYLNGRAFWHTSMTRSMLQTFIRSLLHGTLSLGRGVSVDEAMTTFEFENVSFGDQPIGGEIGPSKQLSAFHVESAHGKLIALCEQLATAIVSWPRLPIMIESAECAPQPHFSLSSTRFWLALVPSRCGGASDLSLANLKLNLQASGTNWLTSVLACVGSLWFDTFKSSSQDPDWFYKTISSPENFESFAANVLAKISSNPFMVISNSEIPRKQSKASIETRRRFSSGLKFVSSLRSLAHHADQNSDSSADRFVSSILQLAGEIMRSLPNLEAVFDEDLGQWQRNQFAKSLRARGLAVVRWADHRNPPAAPLLFPPLHERFFGAHSPAPLPSYLKNAPHVLLEFVLAK